MRRPGGGHQFVEEKLLSTLPTSITTEGTNVSQGNKECKK
jgi:hypothetical protein